MILILILIIGIFFVVLDQVYCRFWKENLKVELDFADTYVYEGETSSLLETITNAKRLPLPILQVAFQTSRNLEFVDEENTSISDMCYKRDVFSVLSYQKITRTLKFSCKKRGYYPIYEAKMESENLFLRHSLLAEEQQNTAIYVYPKMLDVNEVEIPFQKIMGTLKKKQYLYEDPYEIRGIRTYVNTDSMNRINWNASARTGGLMVNVHDSTASQEVVIFLDTEDETILKYPKLHGASIQIVASLAELLILDGIHVSILCNGKDSVMKETIVVPAGNGKYQIDCIKQCLARIDLKLGADPIEGLIKMQAGSQMENDPFYIFISKNQRQGLWYEVTNLLAEEHSGLWIVPLFKDMDLKLQETGRLQIYMWEVENE